MCLSGWGTDHTDFGMGIVGSLEGRGGRETLSYPVMYTVQEYEMKTAYHKHMKFPSTPLQNRILYMELFPRYNHKNASKSRIVITIIAVWYSLLIMLLGSARSFSI